MKITIKLNIGDLIVEQNQIVGFILYAPKSLRDNKVIIKWLGCNLTDLYTKAQVVSSIACHRWKYQAVKKL